MTANPQISIVAPVYNEVEGIDTFIDEVCRVMRKQSRDWELVLVNDGSTDGTIERLQQRRRDVPELVWIDLSRNFGHQAAVTAALSHAHGRAVVVMDADMQDPPSLIPDLIASWEAGNQVVFARRTGRAEKGLRRMGFDLFHRFFRYAIDYPIPADIGVFALLDRIVVDNLHTLPEHNRFLPGLYSWLGFRQSYVEYSRDPRAMGTPKQSFAKLAKYAFDAILSFSYKPIRILGLLGMITAVAAFAIALFFTAKRLLGHEIAFTGFTTLVILVSGLGGLILAAVALVGEYVARIYDEVKQRPAFIVQSSSRDDDPTLNQHQ